MQGKIRFFVLLSFLFGLLALFNSTVIAENIKNLYESRVVIEVSNDAESMINEQPNQALLIEKAFINVLYKVTGSREFLAIEDSKKLIANAENLVQKFGYENIVVKTATNLDAEKENIDEVNDTNQKTGEIKNIPAQQPGNDSENTIEKALPTQKVFWVHFNKQATNQLLNEYGLPVWDSLRPNTLIWLSIEENRQRNILTPALSKQPFDTIKKQAEIRGIPLTIPFGDLEDKNRLTIGDLWGNFSDAILAASQRYHTQAVLAVRIFQEPSGLWIGNWSLYILGENTNWQVKNENLNVLLARGIDRLANNLASRFSIQVVDNKENSLIVQINNVVDFKGFYKVENYLAKLPAIKKSTLVATQRDTLLYDIEYHSNEKHLLQTLNLGNILQKVESSPKENNAEPLDFTPVILDEPNLQVSKNQSSTKSNSIKNPENNQQSLSKNTEKNISGNEISSEAHEDEKRVPLPVPDVEYWLVN